MRGLGCTHCELRWGKILVRSLGSSRTWVWLSWAWLLRARERRSVTTPCDDDNGFMWAVRLGPQAWCGDRQLQPLIWQEKSRTMASMQAKSGSPFFIRSVSHFSLSLDLLADYCRGRLSKRVSVMESEEVRNICERGMWESFSDGVWMNFS